jgi:hypothetical protein
MLIAPVRPVAEPVGIVADLPHYSNEMRNQSGQRPAGRQWLSATASRKVVELVSPEYGNRMAVDPSIAFAKSYCFLSKIGHALLESKHDAAQVTGVLNMIGGVSGPLFDGAVHDCSLPPSLRSVGFSTDMRLEVEVKAGLVLELQAAFLPVALAAHGNDWSHEADYVEVL